MAPADAILVYAQDGIGLRDELVALIRATRDPIRVIDGRGRVGALNLPGAWENCAILVVMTLEAFTDLNLINYVSKAASVGLPLLPVVDDLTQFNFGAVPDALSVLRPLLAKGLRPDNGQGLLDSLREVLGLESKSRLRKVFISYRHSDGEGVAKQVEKFLWTERCAAFLDTIQIEGGAPIQQIIMDELSDKDFVLFIDSPDAPQSGWIAEELNFALQQRIPIAAVRTDPPRQHIGMLGASPAVDWDEANPDRLEKILRLINRGIGARDSLDGRITRLLADIARVRGFTLQTVQGRRRVQLVTPTKEIRLEYEDAAITLERLHRLYTWYSSPPPCSQAIYVCGDDPVLPPTREALSWARQTLPLETMTVQELVSLVSSL